MSICRIDAIARTLVMHSFIKPLKEGKPLPRRSWEWLIDLQDGEALVKPKGGTLVLQECKTMTKGSCGMNPKGGVHGLEWRILYAQPRSYC